MNKLAFISKTGNGENYEEFQNKKMAEGSDACYAADRGKHSLFCFCKEVQAATAGFKTIDGKTYYIKSDGSKQKGWLTLGGYKYYFNTKTGVQVKGWMKVNGKYTYYFTKGKGVMATGWMTDSKGHKRYFNPKTGKLTTGWVNCSKEGNVISQKAEALWQPAGSPTAKGRNVIFTKLPVIWQPNG